MKGVKGITLMKNFEVFTHFFRPPKQEDVNSDWVKILVPEQENLFYFFLIIFSGTFLNSYVQC